MYMWFTQIKVEVKVCVHSTHSFPLFRPVMFVAILSSFFMFLKLQM